jgi:hypothetical protein
MAVFTHHFFSLKGPENGGLVVILSNFNHERWNMTCSTVKNERAIVAECFQLRIPHSKFALETSPSYITVACLDGPPSALSLESPYWSNL